MERRCERCQYEINWTYLLAQKNIDEIICPNCGRKLVATDLSKVVAFSFFILFFIIFYILPLRIITIIIIEIIWVLASKYYLPAFLYLYKEKDEEDY